MIKTLDVYFHEEMIGELTQDNHGEMNFIYHESWLNDPKAMQISFSLPLQKAAFKKNECQAFFGGLLPEDIQRKIIAKNLGISANNNFSLLDKIGGECAGALSFISSGEKLIQNNNHYRELTETSLFNILQELPAKPLLAGDRGVRLSLAGVQDKLAVYINDEKTYIPLDNAPSSHILKPDFSIYEGIVFNEAFCMQLAKKINLSVAEVKVKKIEDIDYLLVKRYDRTNNISDGIQKLHQEDFCQALGVLSTHKYQNEGGPSLAQCFDLLRKATSTPITDLDKMLNAVIFNYIIGNCDAHGKNFSLLYSNQIQLAPLYDLICTIYYKDLDKKMAMKIGGEYQIIKIGLKNFDTLSEEAKLSKPEVHRSIKRLIDRIISALPTMEINHKVQEGVSELIKTRCLLFSKDL